MYLPTLSASLLVFALTWLWTLKPVWRQRRIISFIKEPKIIDRIIGHLKLTFEAARPPPPHNVQQELLMAAEEREEYF